MLVVFILAFAARRGVVAKDLRPPARPAFFLAFNPGGLSAGIGGEISISARIIK